MTPTPKEGPPTLRDVKKWAYLLMNTKDECLWCGKIRKEGHTKTCKLKLLVSIPDSALERDEKRRAALEERYWQAGVDHGFMHGRDGEKWVTRYQDTQTLDALTPTPKEEE